MSKLFPDLCNSMAGFKKLGTPTPTTNVGMQQNTRIGTPPASSFLNAFERSFESFLNNKVDPPASVPGPSPSNDQGSAAGISAILADSSIGSQRIQNPLLSYQSSSNRKQNQENFVGYRKVQGPKFPSKTLTLSKTKTYSSNPRIVEDNIKEASKPTQVSYQDDESTEAVNNLLKAEAGELTPEPERRFACSTCPKTFRSRGHLKEHEMIHTGDFPFNCENCSKGFRREAALLVHKCNGAATPGDTSINVNTASDFRGQKVYKCEQCERSYASKQYFQVHKCTKGNESVTRQSRSLVNEAAVKSARTKAKKENDDDKNLENVHIDIPVTVLSSEIVFRGDDNCAYIEGDIIDVDIEDITLEEAIIEGYQVETLSEHSNTVTLEEIIMKPVPNSSLPCGLELMSLSSGIDVDEIIKVIEFYTDNDQSVEPTQFPWQTVSKDHSKNNNEDGELKEMQENQLLLEEKESSGKLSNTLEELPSVIKSKSTDKPNVSLNKFTYFNDKSIAYGSGDDSDDEDWSEMSEKVKRKPTSKSQSKKPNRNQPNLSQSEKRRSIGQQTRPKIAQNSSLLLQDEDDEEEDFKKEERYS